MKRLNTLLGFLTLALLLVACGGESGPQAVSLSFEGIDRFQFIPDSAEVPAGAEIEVILENAGNLEHSWALISSEAEAADAKETDAISGAATGIVAPGESATITFTAPEAGTYQYVCTVPGHAAAGMVGTLTATE